MAQILSVGQVNRYIKNLISSDYVLRNISVEGEVSNCKYHSSGHIYFTLKDETGQLAAVMFRSSAQKGIDFKLENGQLVTASGQINIYERDGKYQLYVSEIKKRGQGNLYEEYERLKQKLYEQGLFDFEIKKPIPRFPKKVGIVTAGTGAAVQDILSIAKRRNPFVQLYLYPAKVQGEGAAAEIAEGIRVLDRMKLDTIIIGRGGGSIEDLWAFNEEEVAWAIFNAKTPVISGTGHETDNTIADYAADLRAATPSAACEMAIPDVMSAINGILLMEERLHISMENKAFMYRDRLEGLEQQIRLLSPKGRLGQKLQYLDFLSDRIDHDMDNKYKLMLHKLQLITERINGLSPTAKLTGGFGYIAKDSRPVYSAASLEAGDKINIILHDGVVKAQVI